MKRRPETEPPAGGGEPEETGNDTIEISSSADVCKSLMERYAKSSAPQHRHLIASAAAMRSILLEEGLPLTPPAYFAAAITAFRESDHSDAGATAALSAFISILLSLESVKSVMPPAKAKDAAFVLASFLKESASGLATGSVRSVINSLGFLALCVDLEDWSAVELPLQTLLVFTVDKRPKVRRCAQVCVENFLKTVHSSSVIKKASKVVLSMYKKYTALVRKLSPVACADAAWREMLSKDQNIEILHMLNIIKIIVPYLSEKIKMKILSDVYKLLCCHFSWLACNILGVVESLMDHIKVEALVSELENIISALTSYASSAEQNPTDTIISVLELLKTCLNKIHDALPSIWTTYLPLIFTSFAGFLTSDAHTSSHVADILKELITTNIDQGHLLISASQSCNYGEENTPGAIAVTSICTVFGNMINACDVPTEYMLAVISVLFLKLGNFSYLHMKEILLKLSEKAMKLVEDTPNMKHVESCIGAAVIAMGPEKVLELIPISFHGDKLTCSNTWLIPILKKYVIGASLQYFIEHIVPLAKSVQVACNKVRKTAMQKSLQSLFHGLWDLLPAFCRYASDTSQNFESLSKIFIVVLEEDQSLHEIIAAALQELVNSNKYILRPNDDVKHCMNLQSSFGFNDLNMDSICLLYCRKKTASRNMKALAYNSLDLFWTLAEVYFDSPLEKRTCLKEAIGCMASVLGSGTIQTFFVSSLEKLEPIEGSTETAKLEGQIEDGDVKDGAGNTTKNQKHKERRSLMMELASCFVEAADKELINIIFDFVRSLLATDETCQLDAYTTLSRILKEHNWFALARFDELIDLLFSIKSPVDIMVLENRFSCFHYLLVQMLKCKEEDTNMKAFLILNEIILSLKSKKESRKLAYDVLLTTSSSLKNSPSSSAGSDLQKLFNMVMAYLSSSSPHMISGAVSALSLLIYNDASYCLFVPNLVQSVLVLLQNKAIEVTKATLGFVKVLVSSLHSNDLIKLLSDIVIGVMPWSSVSKHHFRSKVAIILEILIRKCGSDAVVVNVPTKYKGFVKTIKKWHQSNKNNKGVYGSETPQGPTDSLIGRGQKRAREDISGPVKNHSSTTNNIWKGKRRKKQGENISNTTMSRFGGKGYSQRKNGDKGGESQPTNSHADPLQAQRKDNDKRKRIVDEKLSGNKSMRNIKRQRSDRRSASDVSPASRSAASSKSIKLQRSV